MSAVAARRAQILLVEDSAYDVELTREVLAESEERIPKDVHVVRDGVAALDFLYRRAPYAHAPRPDLVLLDLNLPRCSGLEVLEIVKADPDLMVVPVIVLTTSRDQEDVADSYRRRANGFITKPLDLDEFAAAMHALERFWLDVARLP